MMMVTDEHVPVLLPQVLDVLGDLQDKVVIDATYGRGGYSRAFLERGAHVIAIDRDPDAVISGQVLELEYPKFFSIVEGCFGDLQELLSPRVDSAGAIVFDLGVSSPQIESESRGFSFRVDSPLDMRMGKKGESASDLLNRLSAGELKFIFKKYGEEPHAGKIAKAIERYRMDEGDIRTTGELANLIEGILPRKHNQRLHPATRVFQALRIAVNDELQQLEDGLSSATEFLSEGGKLAVVSFHSLEDRIVKQKFSSLARERNPSRHVPSMKPEPLNFIDYGKPIVPDAEAIAENSRCRSAKLRILEKRTQFYIAKDVNHE